MCDTLVATAAAAVDGKALFAKNSDREATEAQIVEVHEAADHPDGEMIGCTYLQIPQARRTHKVLICRPFWMWGAEMGVNEHGVAIGNQAVFARVPAPETPALLGMDLVRLCLERAESATQALEILTATLERYGQGGNCGFRIAQFYNNSFLIADRDQAFVLETLGRDWVVEKVMEARSISNCYSIRTGSNWSRSHGDINLTDRLIGGPAADFASAIADRGRDESGRRRQARSTYLLEEERPGLSVMKMMRILRDHGDESQRGSNGLPLDPSIRSICMHSTSDQPRGQTVGSLVAEIGRGSRVHWVTGTAAPCTSLFKPVLLEASSVCLKPRPRGGFGASFWRRHETIHHALIGNSVGRFPAMIAERDALESTFHSRMSDALAAGDHLACERAVAACWIDAAAFERRWMAWLPKNGARHPDPGDEQSGANASPDTGRKGTL